MTTIYAMIAALTISLAAQAAPENLTLSSKVQEGTEVPFIKHAGNGAMDSYLSMNLPYPPMSELFTQVQSQTPEELKSRGEAHITVITPVEFSQELKPYGVTIQQINQIAEELQIQSSKFDIVCLGMGEAEVSGKSEQTYFVVVKSEDLLKIRQQIEDLVHESDEGQSKFKADTFYSHITLGFTKRDLHESDGVIKDQNTCIADLVVSP